MNDLTNQYIDDAYAGLLHASGQQLPATGQSDIYDGLGNKSSLKLGRACNGATICGTLTVDDLQIGSTSFLDKVYPVGSIYLSVNSTNPASLFGGTWEQVSQGRFLVGVGTGSDSETTKTYGVGNGGGKYFSSFTIPVHTHGVGVFSNPSGNDDAFFIYGQLTTPVTYNIRQITGDSNSYIAANTTINSPQGILTTPPIENASSSVETTPPAFGVYIFKRTA